MTGRRGSEQERILQFWWMLELFSPQRVPKLTSRVPSRGDDRVIEWEPGAPLPWETLAPPTPTGKSRRVWKHTVYLGVYDLEATYGSLHIAFGDDRDAYDEREAGRSACAGVVVDATGRLAADSLMLSSALWAVGRIETSGVGDRRWAEGFPDAQEAFREAVDEHEMSRCEAVGAEEPVAQDEDSMLALLRIGQRVAGVDGRQDLATGTVVIKSVAVSADRGDDAISTDFLNSFYLQDLASVRSAVTSDAACGAALMSYLTSDGALSPQTRVDVIRTHDVVNDGVSPDRIPKGRWPSDPEKALSLRQQFAVNHALSDLAPGRGLMAVNGPPGTGKTTMLRDVIAGNVVERARRLAALARPEDAFTEAVHRWKSGKYTMKAPQLQEQLTGYEMVVASANNTAVENVSREIPAREAISDRWDQASYFADIATAVLAESGSRKTGQAPVEAWGMIAAQLGKKSNRNAFRSSFWFDKKNPHTQKPVPDSPPRMLTRLTQWADGTVPHQSWKAAREDFVRAEQRVDELIAGRVAAQERGKRTLVAAEAERRSVEHADCAQAALNDAEHEYVAALGSSEAAARADELAVSARDRHVGVKPGLLETLFSRGRAIREWREALQPLEERVDDAETLREQAEARAYALRERIESLRRSASAAAAARSQASEDLNRLQEFVRIDRKNLGLAYPEGAWAGEQRELRAPWLDAELDAARSDLFLAAVKLHQDFLSNSADTMIAGLRAALEVVAGGGPRNLEPEKRRAAWQLFFLVVPVVSTTFASFGRMFGNLGAESLGWVLIDEAGQAPPQYAAGAIWRAQRVIAVGDPLQLQPVVTIPNKAQHDIGAASGISGTWMPPQASVQTLADRVSRHGTSLEQGDKRVWVSAPLTVHRRCDDPMFTLCNDIAYNGIMVNGIKQRGGDSGNRDNFDSPNGPLIAPSQWLDEPALTRGTHLQENQITRLEDSIACLIDHGIPLGDMIAISPFRAVANRLESLSTQRQYSGLAAGTIHTAQGREASVVFLVLGGDPASPGAKAWAASSVNLVNVAASRAKRRLYVIGDRDAWAKHNYFNQLAASLSP